MNLNNKNTIHTADPFNFTNKPFILDHLPNSQNIPNSTSNQLISTPLLFSLNSSSINDRDGLNFMMAPDLKQTAPREKRLPSAFSYFSEKGRSDKFELRVEKRDFYRLKRSRGSWNLQAAFFSDEVDLTIRKVPLIICGKIMQVEIF